MSTTKFSRSALEVLYKILDYSRTIFSSQRNHKIKWFLYVYTLAFKRLRDGLQVSRLILSEFK